MSYIGKAITAELLYMTSNSVAIDLPVIDILWYLYTMSPKLKH